MTESGPAGVFFDLPEPLPRGQHGLTREQVRGAQRERLLRAFTELLAEVGYERVKVSCVCERAGVSHATFYELFSGKEDCVCAAYERYIEVVWRRAETIDVGGRSTWRSFIEGSLDAYFDVLAADPVVSRGFHVEMHDIGPEAGRRQAASLHRFARVRVGTERELRKRDPLLKTRPFSVHLGSIHVQRVLAREELRSSPRPDLSKLRGELVEWLVDSWYGGEPPREDVAAARTRPQP